MGFGGDDGMMEKFFGSSRPYNQECISFALLAL
jgi:hypothetical protein